MTDEDQNEPLELTEVVDEGDDTPPEQHDEPEEYSLEIEGDEPDEDAAIEALPEEHRGLPKKLRDQLKAEQREKHDLQRRLTALEQGAKPAPIEVGKKPDLWEDCDGDPDRYEADLMAWHARDRAAKDQEGEAARAVQAQQAEYQKDLNNYVAKKAALPIAQEKKDAAEKLMIDTLPQILQSALIKYTDDPAKVAVALAASPQKLAALASEKDPIRFIIAVRDMESKVKMVSRKKPPAPESASIVRGSAPLSGNRSKTLEKLETEARSTGDRTKLIAYKASQRQKEKAA